jgi:hypothetical protein
MLLLRQPSLLLQPSSQSLLVLDSLCSRHAARGTMTRASFGRLVTQEYGAFPMGRDASAAGKPLWPLIAAGGLGCTVLRAYSGSMYPTVSGGDRSADSPLCARGLISWHVVLVYSGELLSAACHLGMSHPPGYQLYTVLSWLFIKLLSFGNPAARVNFLSCCIGAAAAICIFEAIRQWCAVSIGLSTALLTTLRVVAGEGALMGGRTDGDIPAALVGGPSLPPAPSAAVQACVASVPLRSHRRPAFHSVRERPGSSRPHLHRYWAHPAQIFTAHPSGVPDRVHAHVSLPCSARPGRCDLPQRSALTILQPARSRSRRWCGCTRTMRKSSRSTICSLLQS